jgi:hypothetical protein
MRHYQRGLATTLILIIFLIAGVAIVSGAVVFYQNQKKIEAINSFEECAKYFPVMNSYPGQCRTSDGRHFVQELSEEEKQRLVPPIVDVADDESLACSDEKKNKVAGDFVKGDLLVGFNTPGLEESKKVVASHNLNFKEEYSSQALNILNVKVTPGEEFKWMCILEKDPNIKYIELNQVIKLDDCNKGPC